MTTEAGHSAKAGDVVDPDIGLPSDIAVLVREGVALLMVRRESRHDLRARDAHGSLVLLRSEMTDPS